MVQQQDLTKGHIPQLIRKIAVPASIGFFFHTMYNVVDTYYSGLISTEALAALSLSFPVFFVIIAISSGFGTGATALISNALGEKKKDQAKQYASQSVSFGFILSVFLTILGLVTSPALFRLLGAQGEYLNIALSYMNVVFFGTVFFVLNQMFNASLTATGDTKTFRNFLILGFFLNLILDPLFLFGWKFIPKLGFPGIALATISIQAVGTVYLGYRVVKTGLISKDCWQRLIPEKKSYKDIAHQGFPASLNMMTVAIGVFVITYFVSWFGQDGVAAFGTAIRIEQIALLPTIGLNIATLAIVGQNNGAKKYDRIRETLKTAIKYGIYILTIGYIGVFFFSKQLMSIFSSDPVVVEIGSQYLHFATFISWAYVILFVTVSALQGIKKPMFAVWIGIYRQVLAPAAIYYFLAVYLGWELLGVWWGTFIVTWSAAIITILYARNVMKDYGIIKTEEKK